MRPNLSRAGAEKLFNRKASPDASLTSKQFLKKKIVQPVKNYAKNVAGGAKIVGGAIKNKINKIGTRMADDLFGSPELNKKQREAGAKLNREYSGLPSNVKYRK